MIAHVALLRRMPRKIDYLDYLVPEGMAVARGDLVIVPFRTAFVQGVVLSMGDQGGQMGQPLRPIISIESKHWISDADLSMLEATARDLVQSVSTMLQATTSKTVRNAEPSHSPIKPMIRRSEVPYIQSAVNFVRTNNECFIECLDVVQAVALVEAIKKNIPGPHRVFVPTHHDAQWIPDSMTRGGILKLGQHPAVDIVVRSGAPEHASYDRNPRYDLRRMLGYHFKKLVFIDVCPRVLDLVHFPSLLSVSSDLRTEPTIIDLADQQKVGFTSLLTDPLIAAITNALQNKKSVLLSYNRKGLRTGLLCRDCSYQPRCQNCGSLPTVYEAEIVCHHCGASGPSLTTCPKCRGTRLTSRGVGNQQVEKKLRELFPDVVVVRIEKSVGPIRLLAAPTIILATRYYLDAIFNPFAPPTFGLVADLCGDLGLSEPTYSATEQTLIRLMELRGVAARAKCPFIVQTWDTPLTRRMLNDHLGFLREELALRQSVHLPPYGIIYRLSIRGKTTIDEVKQLLKDQLVGLRMRQHTEKKKPILELYVQPGLSGNLRSTLKQLKDDVIIEVA